MSAVIARLIDASISMAGWCGLRQTAGQDNNARRGLRVPSRQWDACWSSPRSAYGIKRGDEAAMDTITGTLDQRRQLCEH